MYKKPSTARQIQHAYEKLLDANLRDKAPAWLKAMQKTPTAASLVRDPSYFSTKGQLPFEKTRASATADAGSSAIEQVSRSLPAGCVTINHRKRSLKTRSPKPPKIEFPEDALRQEFYKRHPFELLRPRIVMEPNGRTEKDWSRLSNGSSQVTGEQVIRYQHYLMETSGLSEQEAYSKATDEFYKVRAREEMEAKIAAQEAKAYGARPLDKPYSTHQLAMEDREIRKSAQIIKRRQEEQRMRSVTTEKMFAGDSA